MEKNGKSGSPANLLLPQQTPLTISITRNNPHILLPPLLPTTTTTAIPTIIPHNLAPPHISLLPLHFLHHDFLQSHPDTDPRTAATSKKLLRVRLPRGQAQHVQPLAAGAEAMPRLPGAAAVAGRAEDPDAEARQGEEVVELVDKFR